MDDTDRALIALLRDEARLPVATLAGRLGVSRGTVQARMARLAETGIVQGYTVRLRADAEPHAIRAITTIGIEGERLPAVVRALRRLPEVRSIHSTNGRWDLIVELRTESLQAFDEALQRLRLVKGIASSETSLLLSTYQG